MSDNKAGSYVVTTVYSIPWKKTTKKPQVKKSNKKITNEIFEKCADLSEDRFWRDMFHDCARGKFPRGFSFKNNLITFRKGNKTDRVSISDSPVETYQITIDFFKKANGLMSKKDRDKISKEEEERLLEILSNKEINWKDVKTDKFKNILIHEFAYQISENSNFNKEERKQLITTIKKGIMLKCFNSRNIMMENKKIKEIKGLIFDYKKHEYIIDEKIYKNYIKNKKVIGLGLDTEKRKPKISFLEDWKKYLEKLETIKLKKKGLSSSQSYDTKSSDTFSESINTPITPYDDSTSP